MDTSQYIDLFIEEAREHLQALSDNLLELERDPGNANLIQAMFRSAHTIKGMAASMGFERMAHLTHEMEDRLDDIRSGRAPLADAFIDALFACVDALEGCLQAIVEEGSDASASVEEASRKLAAALGSTTSAEIAATGELAAAKPADAAVSATGEWDIQVRFAADCSMPAVRAYMVYQALQEGLSVTRTDPALERVMAGECGLEFHIFSASGVDVDAVRSQALEVAEVDSVEVTQVAAAAPAAAPSSGAVPGTAQSASGKQSQPAAGAPRAATQAGAKKNQRASQSIRVDLSRLDDVMNRFSEIVMDKTRLRQLASERQDAALEDAVHHFERVCDELQSLLLRIRMLPVDTVFQRFPRMVRDLAKSLGKQVELRLEGQETELDRTVMDEIGDSLVHLIRNALDHGLETPAERREAGKPETGVLRLSAYQQGDDVFIEVRDDGRGLNREKIARKAVEMGLLEADEAAKLSDEQVYGLLFASGFSTAESVSDVSGRGVGLDAVRDTIVGLGGEVDVQSEPGRGTSFILRVPLTLSIIQAMLVRIEDERYAIPLSSLVQIYQVEPEQVKENGNRRYVELGGRLLRLVDAREWLGLEPVDRAQDVIQVAVLGRADKALAVIVDEFLDTEEIVVKPLGGYLQGRIPGISGAAILGDGAVVLIFDAAAWVAQAAGQR
ncbi:chemotaxis protein CheA [Alicyclobacillus kakegawensis]|uniref:chemotaxis protein CheA n=1 Tax=Alicyclobacillus kakegawensis TaxID=392012 RepID=UPI0008297DA2|nr:chemotaxis protein CheA [Alicyclobacillus kakegawensis]